MFRVLLLRDDRIAEIRKGYPGPEAFLGKSKGLFVLDPSSIQPWIEKARIKGSEIIFFESNASPVPVKKPVPAPEGGLATDPSSAYLDRFIYLNAVEQTGDPRILGWVSTIGSALKAIVEPGNFIRIFFFLLLTLTIIRGLLSGGF